MAAGAELDFNDTLSSSPNRSIHNLQGDGSVVIGTSAATTLRISAGNFSGVISGAGGLLRGDGFFGLDDVLILSGANTYAGKTTIDGGTLQLGNGGTTGSIVSTAVTLDHNGRLIFNRSDTVAFGAPIDGVGDVQQNGTGTTVLNTINTYFGATTVSGGTLAVNGSIANSATTVNNGGTLKGTGQLGSVTVADGGIHAPGNSIGTQKVGNYALQAGRHPRDRGQPRRGRATSSSSPAR